MKLFIKDNWYEEDVIANALDVGVTLTPDEVDEFMKLYARPFKEFLAQYGNEWLQQVVQDFKDERNHHD